MMRCANCTLRDLAEGCPLRGTPRFPCGYDKDEIKRRRRLPLMLDEELAAFLFTSNGCPMWVSEYSCKEDKGCHGTKGACWLDWLKQEASP